MTSLCASSAHHNTGRRVTTTSRGANNRNSCRRRVVPSSRADADASRTDDEDKNERRKRGLETKKDSRRAFVACSGCAFCFAASFSEAARAFPKLLDLNDETVEDVNYVLDHRNQRTDKVFAKASECLCFSSFFANSLTNSFQLTL